jgi:hypothetical protein
VLNRRLVIAFLPILVLLAVSACTSNGSTTDDHGYYKEQTEFTLRVTDNPSNIEPVEVELLPVIVQARYICKDTVVDKRESDFQKTAYIFETDTSDTVYLLIPPGIADSINLIPDERYQIDYQIQYGWPNIYRLIISVKDVVIFAGLSDWTVDGRLNMNELIPVKISENRLLDNNYIIGQSSDFWEKKTNTEITFTLGESSVILHQGQSSLLGDYEVKLLIARKIDYKPNWYDVCQNSISYTISRTN